MLNNLRKFTVFLMVALVMCTGSCAEMLQENTNADALIIQPRYSYTNHISAELSFSNGKAICKGRVEPSGDYDVTVTVTLYKKEGANWKYIASWSGSATDGLTASASGSISVERGTYKVVTSGNVSGLEYPSAKMEKIY